MAPSELHTRRPSVYLDLWVWISLALADAGRPKLPGDSAALDALREAAAAGVAFPLSTTHYIETAKIKKPEQRRDLARVMASVSYFRTLRSRRALVRHQMLAAMHETFGRPAFRPAAPEALGLGVAFAFTGEQRLGTIKDKVTGAEITKDELPDVGEYRREANQLAQLMVVAGPADDEVEVLRRNGYRPETSKAMAESRLEWEQLYAATLRDDPISARELRVRVQARELVHEDLDLFNELLGEYRINLDREFGIRDDSPGSARPKIVAFCDRIPTMRLAVDMKTALFRNAARVWQMNDLYDIDALSLAIPYCHVVLTDKDAVDRVHRDRGDGRHGTAVVSSLSAVLERLPDLVAEAKKIGGDPTGWDVVGPGDGFMATLPDGSLPSFNVQRSS